MAKLISLFTGPIRGLTRVGASAFRLVLIALPVWLGACLLQNDEKQAGVDDFPNSIYARVSQHMDEAEESEVLPVPDATLPSPQAEVRVSAAAKSAAQAGMPALTGSPTMSLRKMASASLGSLAHATRADGDIPVITSSRQIGDTLFIDSTFFLPGTDLADSTLRILGLVRFKHVELRGASETRSTVVSDGDGDGLLFLPLVNAKLEFRVETQSGDTVGYAESVFDGGSDGKTDTEADNRIYRALSYRRIGSDTLELAEYADGDDDGIILDNAVPSLADLRFMAKNPRDDRAVAERRVNMRLVAVFGREKQEIRRFSSEETLRDGRLRVTQVSDLDGGEDLLPGIRARVQVVVTGYAAEDSLTRLETRFVMQPEGAFGFDEDSLVSYEIFASKHLGEEIESHFLYTAAKPMAPHADPGEGRISFQIHYADATEVTLEGEWKNGALDARIVARDQTVYVAKWEASGKLVKLEVTRP